MAKHKLKWRCGYKTFRYDTPDGDLDINEYAEHPNGKCYCIRVGSKKVVNTIKVEKDGFDLEDRKKVNIIGHQVYQTFWLPDGKIMRIKDDTDGMEKRRTVSDYPQPTKELTDGELQVWQ